MDDFPILRRYREWMDGKAFFADRSFLLARGSWPPDTYAMDRSGICYLCGLHCDPEKHREHVPPRACFPKGTIDLVEVCCCKTCNNSNSRNDEFFRLITALAPKPSVSGAEVWQRAVDRTVNRGRLRREIAALLANSRAIEGQPYVRAGLPVSKIRRQVIRITKGFIRHYYPELDYHRFEFHVMILDQPKLAKTFRELFEEKAFSYHHRGNGAHRLLYGVAMDTPRTEGLWFHVFHDAHGFVVYHRVRQNVKRAHSGVAFDSTDADTE